MDASTLFRSGSYRDAGEQTARFRWACLVPVLAMVVLGAGLYRQSDWATSVWPWPDVRMTYIFLASMVASTAAIFAWVAWRNEPGALDALAFELMIGGPVTGVYLLRLAVEWRDRDVALAGTGFLLAAVAAAVMYRRTRTIPIKDPRRLPVVYRGALVAFCGILIVIGSMLAFQRPNIFPWNISPQTSTMIGLMFLSAALLFGFVAVRPMWAYGEMALTSFLAYDIVLFIPYIDLLRNIDDTATLSSYYGATYTVASPGSGIRETNLIVYLTVLAFSALLAISIYVWGAMARRRGPEPLPQ